jgi:hypothetical protein
MWASCTQESVRHVTIKTHKEIEKKPNTTKKIDSLERYTL